MAIPILRSPIVLVHGLLGFDEFSVCGWRLASYFPGIKQAFQEAGNRVLLARLSPTRGVIDRATELKAFLDKHSPTEPVHILAHSMGGLDTRYMLSKLDMAPRVLSLTTLGTPHRGTFFADWALEHFEPVIGPVLDFLRIPGQAFHDLSMASCQRFNADVPDMPGVRYFSVAGKHESTARGVHWHMSRRIVSKEEGPNDGVVAVRSATYGEDCQVWDGDHLSLANWPCPTSSTGIKWRDRRGEYGQLVGRLKDEGF